MADGTIEILDMVTAAIFGSYREDKEESPQG